MAICLDAVRPRPQHWGIACNTCCLECNDICWSAHRRDEAVAAARDRFDETGRLGRVAERGPDLRDAEIETALEIDERRLAPDGRPQIVAGDQLSRALHQQCEDAGRLRLEADRRSLAREHARGRVEFEESKTRATHRLRRV